MIDQLFERENYVIAKKLLDVSHTRHQAISSNLANIETPGYKRLDVKEGFDAQLKKLSGAGKVDQIGDLEVSLRKDVQTPSVRADGNNVQIDAELLEMSKNATEYEFLTHYTSNSVKRLKTAITGRVM